VETTSRKERKSLAEFRIKPDVTVSQKQEREKREKEKDAWNEQTGKNPDDMEIYHEPENL